ncbi:MAG: phosphatase PAP2 family protein, partial [Thalassolituus sp.]
RMGHQRAIRLLFKGISRLGDGVFWYTLAIALPLLAGMQGLEKLGHITVTGLLCILIYSQLKNRLVRKRPFISFPDIHAHTAPLDKYSFPSGHTMNAVNFAVLFT